MPVLACTMIDENNKTAVLREYVRIIEYHEALIALNKNYQQLLPDLTPHIKKVIADLRGLGARSEASESSYPRWEYDW